MSEVEYGEDRLSNLPDEIIHHVLSFLEAVSAVQTSVLSKRWRPLWTSLPVLNFQSSSFYDPILFPVFVNRFLALRDASVNVHVFKLTNDNGKPDDGKFLDSIIDHVTLKPFISASVQVLTILAQCFRCMKLPELSICRFLTTLKLTGLIIITTPFDFVSLKQFHLSDCLFDFAEADVLDLFVGCVNLTCLFLHNCDFAGKIGRFLIFAPLLLDLSIHRMRVDDFFDSDLVIQLSTPKLQSFSYLDNDLYQLSIQENLSFVHKVHIVMNCLTENANFSLRLIELFEVMPSVKFLSLSSEIIQVLDMFPDLLVGRSSPFTRLLCAPISLKMVSRFWRMKRDVLVFSAMECAATQRKVD
ncbi:hypothetical protein VNO78_23692 [Psophocarpus tetragonolobus]|uniref:F-box domain-containing protein n=1 Tax=Psophocarpus tetragonolobus TaxID=3891 RepID=A0AAN9S4Y2_PSOTE